MCRSFTPVWAVSWEVRCWYMHPWTWRMNLKSKCNYAARKRLPSYLVHHFEPRARFTLSKLAWVRNREWSLSRECSQLNPFGTNFVRPGKQLVAVQWKIGRIKCERHLNWVERSVTRGLNNVTKCVCVQTAQVISGSWLKPICLKLASLLNT